MLRRDPVAWRTAIDGPSIHEVLRDSAALVQTGSLWWLDPQDGSVKVQPERGTRSPRRGDRDLADISQVADGGGGATRIALGAGVDGRRRRCADERHRIGERSIEAVEIG